jgi:hypothetical protein
VGACAPFAEYGARATCHGWPSPIHAPSPPTAMGGSSLARSFLLNVNHPASTACRVHDAPREPEVCLRIFHKNCLQHAEVYTRGKPRYREAICKEIGLHIRKNCMGLEAGNGTEHRGRVRAVHFKGRSHKPWSLVRRECSPLRGGALRILDPVDAVPPSFAKLNVRSDAIAWVAQQRSCMARNGSRQVFWANHRPMKARRCCSFFGMLSAQWYEFDRLRLDEY